jgi:hypothetical protein
MGFAGIAVGAAMVSYKILKQIVNGFFLIF